MASEHQHKWTWALGESGSTERHCACGDEDWYAPASDLMYSIKQMSQDKEETEQQLAQAREEIAEREKKRWRDNDTLIKAVDITIAQEQELKQVQAQNAAMRALLATLISTAIDYDENDLSRCQLCEARQATADRIQHDVDCPIGKARAFLAEHPA